MSKRVKDMLDCIAEIEAELETELATVTRQTVDEWQRRHGVNAGLMVWFDESGDSSELTFEVKAVV